MSNFADELPLQTKFLIVAFSKSKDADELILIVVLSILPAIKTLPELEASITAVVAKMCESNFPEEVTSMSILSDLICLALILPDELAIIDTSEEVIGASTCKVLLDVAFNSFNLEFE